MCTIEEKDVLLEYIADTAGMVLTGGSGKYSPAEPAMLAQIRDRFYATDCSELDFTQEFNQLTELRKKYHNNQEQLQHSPEQYDVRKDAQEKFETVWAFVSANCRPVDRPSLYLSGGQPGAGKSRAIVRAQQLENGNLLNVVGDDFRKFCSLYGYYNQKYGRESSRYTGEFAGIMVGMIRDRAVAEKYNIAIEGTFRTSEIPLRELQTFTSSGYTAHVIICTCPAELSWQSTITRAKKMEDGGFPSRYVPREHYDTVVGQLAHNVQIIYDSALAADLQIISREKILFNSASEADRNADITVAEVINRELNRQLPIIKK